MIRLRGGLKIAVIRWNSSWYITRQLIAETLLNNDNKFNPNCVKAVKMITATETDLSLLGQEELPMQKEKIFTSQCFLAQKLWKIHH